MTVNGGVTTAGALLTAVSAAIGLKAIIPVCALALLIIGLVFWVLNNDNRTRRAVRILNALPRGNGNNRHRDPGEP